MMTMMMNLVSMEFDTPMLIGIEKTKQSHHSESIRCSGAFNHITQTSLEAVCVWVT